MPLHREPVLTEELVLTEEPVLTAALLAKKEAACAGACRSSRSWQGRVSEAGGDTTGKRHHA